MQRNVRATQRFAAQRSASQRAATQRITLEVLLIRSVEVDIVGRAVYSPSRMHDTPKLNGERPDEYEERTWREKSNYDKNGIVFIPSMAFKQAIDKAAKNKSLQIPGRGKATFTKHIVAGIYVSDNASLGIHKDDMEKQIVNANADGVRGSGKRVKRFFPITPDPDWKTTVNFLIMDPVITKEIFEEFLTDAGFFVGVGRFRPENGGINGRFVPVAFRYSEIK